LKKKKKIFLELKKKKKKGLEQIVNALYTPTAGKVCDAVSLIEYTSGVLTIGC
jgi:hypothetical protein